VSTDERLERAQHHYDLAVFGGDASGLDNADRDLDSLEAELTLARGRVLHARFLAERSSSGEHPVEDPRELELFTHAAQLFRAVGDVRGEADAAFWIGCCLQVVRYDDATAVPYFERARELAGQAGDKLTVSFALRHLAFARLGADDFGIARQLLEESTELRKEVGFHRGVAANLVVLADLTAAQGKQDEALAFATQAESVAAECGAHGMVTLAAQARARISGTTTPEPTTPAGL
jgi:tetratricopeptide repeat protein